MFSHWLETWRHDPIFCNTWTQLLCGKVSDPPEVKHQHLLPVEVSHLVAVHGWLLVGKFLHWDQTATGMSDSLSVEISAYVLLAKLSHNPTAEALRYANHIVRWLTEQQNHYGGFSSTQVCPNQLGQRRSWCTGPQCYRNCCVKTTDGTNQDDGKKQVTISVEHNMPNREKHLQNKKEIPTKNLRSWHTCSIQHPYT